MKAKLYSFLILLNLVSVLAFAQQQYAEPDYATTSANTAITLNVMANDIGFSPNYCVLINNSGLSSMISPQNGTVTVSGQSIVYQPNPGFVGNDYFTYAVAVCGTTNIIDTAGVSITVVQDSTLSCQAYFSYQTGSSGQVYFFGSNINGNPADSTLYYWSFNNSLTSNLQNPVITFSSNQAYVCLTISTANGCTSTYCDTILINNTNCNIVITGTVVNATTQNSADGSITTSVTNASVPVTYMWNTGAATPNITGLNPGTYAVTVTDSQNCSNSAYFTVASLDSTPVFSVSVTTNPSSANACNGTATFNFMNGNPPYIIQNSGMSYTTQLPVFTIENICPGTYTATIYDNLQNSATVTYIVGSDTISTPLTATVLTTPASNNTCDGSVIINATGGAAPYSYSYYLSSNTNPFIGGNVLDSLCPGTYVAIITDASGAQVTLSFTIYENTVNPNDSLLWVDVVTGIGQNVPPGCNGIANVNVLGGTPPYAYSWSNSETTQNLMNLCPGYYCVTVTDANGLTAFGCASLDSVNTTVVPIDTLASQVDTCFITSVVDSAWVNSVSTNASGLVTGVWIIIVNGQSYTIIVPYDINTPGTYNLVLVINCSGSKALYTFNTNYYVTPEELIATSIKDNNHQQLNVYPNPFSDIIKVESSMDIQSITLYSVQGAIVYLYSEFKSGMITLPVNALKSGTYFLQLISKDGSVITKKIIK